MCMSPGWSQHCPARRCSCQYHRDDLIWEAAIQPAAWGPLAGMMGKDRNVSQKKEKKRKHSWQCIVLSYWSHQLCLMCGISSLATLGLQKKPAGTPGPSCAALFLCHITLGDSDKLLLLATPASHGSLNENGSHRFMNLNASSPGSMAPFERIRRWGVVGFLCHWCWVLQFQKAHSKT